MTARLRWILLSALLLGVTPHARQVIIRVPPPVATVTIQLPSVSATYDAGVASSIPVSGIATTLTSVTGCTWTNSLGGSGAATGVPNYTWSIASVPLAFGSNVVTIFCADVYLQTGTAVITITRTLPPIPTVTITAPTASPTFDAGTASTITVAGTASTAATITGCTWVNSLGGSGSASGTTSWSVTNLPLTIGTNTVTVTCLDQFSQAGNDVIAITRSASGPSANPIVVSRMPSTSATLPDSVWAAAGVQGGIPSATWANCNNTACTNIAPGGGSTPTAALVQAALNGAQVGGVACSSSNRCVVRLKAGTFTMSTGLLMRSDVALRGAGPNSTFLTFTGAYDACSYSGSYTPAICASVFSGPDGDVNWTAGYTKGTTRITLASRTNIVAGVTPLHLNRNSETDGYPGVGDHFICDTGGLCSSTSGGAGLPGGVGLAGKAVVQDVLATDCVSAGGVSQACTGAGFVDIDPPLYIEDFTGGVGSPQAHYATNGTVSWAGIEDLSIDFTNANGSGPKTGISWINTSNTWIRNIRLVNTGSAGFGFALGRQVHMTLRDSYIYRTTLTAQSNYAVSLTGVGSLLYENNICQGDGCNFTSDNSLTGSVFAYNFDPGNDGPSFIRHLAGEVMNLVEGNVTKVVWSDDADGTGCCTVVFRNALIGNRYNISSGTSSANSAFFIQANSRDWSVVGNVAGYAALWTTYEGQSVNGSCGDNSLLYNLGASGCSGGSNSSDARTKVTLFRWMNWDEITSTSPTTNGDQTGTRACAVPLPANCGTGNNGTGTPQNEVPTGLTNYANPIPASQTLPNSLYLSSKPSFFGSQPWPGIGPDVSGGNVTQMGGHVTWNPAAVCFFTTMGGATNGTGGPYAFTCW